jgi:hypothetical protein
MSSGVVAVLVIVLVVLAVAAGLLLNRRRSPDSSDGAEPVVMVSSWLGAGEMVGRVATLAAVLIAFGIVQGFLTYSSAATAAQNEADAVRGMFEVASYEPPPQRGELQAAAVCYARAVSHLEWEAMRSGDTSPVVTGWTGRFRRVLESLGDDQRSSFTMLLTENRDREVARQQRMVVTEPTLPATILWLMVIAAAISIGWLAFSLPRVPRRAPLIVALALLSVVTAAALLVALDLQRPFAGLVRVPPQAMSAAEGDMIQSLVDQQGTDRVPCDAQGRRT